VLDLVSFVEAEFAITVVDEELTPRTSERGAARRVVETKRRRRPLLHALAAR
jgi:hypothetical protein